MEDKMRLENNRSEVAHGIWNIESACSLIIGVAGDYTQTGQFILLALFVMPSVSLMRSMQRFEPFWQSVDIGAKLRNPWGNESSRSTLTTLPPASRTSLANAMVSSNNGSKWHAF
jgi:hypothetical protein